MSFRLFEGAAKELQSKPSSGAAINHSKRLVATFSLARLAVESDKDTHPLTTIKALTYTQTLLCAVLAHKRAEGCRAYTILPLFV